MVPKEFLLIAGDAENDRLAATLVAALREELTDAETGYGEGLQPLHASVEPRFYGAGGLHMAESGVELVSRTEALPPVHSRSLKRWLTFRRAFGRLYPLAVAREPHAIIGLGFFGFNLRFAQAIKRYVRHREGTFCNWNPILVQFGVPSRWLGRAARLRQAGRDFDLLLRLESTGSVNFATNQRVEFVGPIQGSAEAAAASRRAARAIVRLLMEDEAHFPLRAYLSGS